MSGTIRLATEKVSEKSLEAYNACRLITLNKNPGVRPIGVGEVLRRIIGKFIIKRIENDLRFLGDNTQLCLGQKCGIEHAIHSLRSQYEKPDNESVILQYAKNAFNCLNRNLAVENIKRICPALNFVVQNSYSAPSDFYVAGKTLQSVEGTTQGDPIAMAMYGVATLSLLMLVQNTHVSQKWYVDDGSAVGHLEDLLLFFKQLTEHGGYFGYSENQLRVKEASKIKALRLFEGTAVDIVDGCRDPGSVIGNEKPMRPLSKPQLKVCQFVEKIRASSKNIPLKRLRMPHKRRATKIKFRVQDNTKLTEYLHRRRSQHPNARPTVVL